MGPGRLLAVARARRVLLIVGRVPRRSPRSASIAAVPPGGTRTGGAHHGYALAVIGRRVLPIAVGAVRGPRGRAALGLVVLALAALVIVLAVDWPDDRRQRLARRRHGGRASAGAGFYLRGAGRRAAPAPAARVRRRRSRRGRRAPARGSGAAGRRVDRSLPSTGAGRCCRSSRSAAPSRSRCTARPIGVVALGSPAGERSSRRRRRTPAARSQPAGGGTVGRPREGREAAPKSGRRASGTRGPAYQR